MQTRVSRSRVVAPLTIAGVAGPALFWVLLLISQWLHPGYNAWENSVSRLTFAPFGWLQTMNFCLVTVFTAAFGVAVWLAIARSALGRIASVFLILMGLAQLLTAVFRVDALPSGNSPAYAIHKAVLFVSVGAFPFGAAMLVPDLWASRQWRPFAYMSIAATATVLGLDLVWVVARYTQPHLIDPWFGIYERTLLSIPLVWMMAMLSISEMGHCGDRTLLYAVRRH